MTRINPIPYLGPELKCYQDYNGIGKMFEDTVICCHEKCGTCGGNRCAKKGKHRCCTGNILGQGNHCGDWNRKAPCIIEGKTIVFGVKIRTFN